MEFLGVGWQELIFILVIALIVLGPRDMQKAGRTIGRWLNQLVRSDSWKVVQRTSSELRNLPRTLMREANLEMMQAEKELRQAVEPRPGPRASRPDLPPSKEADNTIQPPADNVDAPAVLPEDESSTAASEAAAATDDSQSAQDADEHV